MDDFLKGETQLFGETKNIEVEPEFYLGGIPQSMQDMDVVQKNLGRNSTNFDPDSRKNVFAASIYL